MSQSSHHAGGMYTDCSLYGLCMYVCMYGYVTLNTMIGSTVPEEIILVICALLGKNKTLAQKKVSKI